MIIKLEYCNGKIMVWNASGETFFLVFFQYLLMNNKIEIIIKY